MTLGQMLKHLEAALAEAGVASPRREADIIIEHVTGMKAAERILEIDSPLPADSTGRILEILERRKLREPLQYCLGETFFMGLAFAVTPGVFIPRQDTECLVECVLEHLQAVSSPRIGEVGTGSGAIAVSLLKYRQDATVTACDISEPAVECTRANAGLHGVESRLSLIRADWLDWLAELEARGERLDAFVWNPPYIARKDKETLEPEVLAEPHTALFGSDDDGLGFYRAMSVLAGKVMKPGAFIAVEIGCDQDEVAAIFRNAGWTGVELRRDLSGNWRCVVAECAKTPFEAD